MGRHSKINDLSCACIKLWARTRTFHAVQFEEDIELSQFNTSHVLGRLVTFYFCLKEGKDLTDLSLNGTDV